MNLFACPALTLRFVFWQSVWFYFYCYQPSLLVTLIFLSLVVIPKRNSVFSVEINGFTSFIYGSKFEQRASERSAKKFKVKGTVDLWCFWRTIYFNIHPGGTTLWTKQSECCRHLRTYRSSLVLFPIARVCVVDCQACAEGLQVLLRGRWKRPPWMVCPLCRETESSHLNYGSNDLKYTKLSNSLLPLLYRLQTFLLIFCFISCIFVNFAVIGLKVIKRQNSC